MHRNYLSIITYVGCLISALASICTIFFLYFRYSLMVHPTLPVCVLSLAMNTWVGTSSPRAVGDLARSIMKVPCLKKAEFSCPGSTLLVRSPAGCSETPALFNDFGKSPWLLLWMQQAEVCKDLFKDLEENMSVFS